MSYAEDVKNGYREVYLVTCIDKGRPNNPHKHIILNMPNYYDKGWYIQVGSFSAFFHSYKPHLIRNQDQDLLYHATRYEERKGSHEHFRGFYDAKPKLVKIKEFYDKPFEDTLDVIATVDSIWEFYDFINFDYKAKRYKHDVDGSQIRKVRKQRKKLWDERIELEKVRKKA